MVAEHSRSQPLDTRLPGEVERLLHGVVAQFEVGATALRLCPEGIREQIWSSMAKLRKTFGAPSSGPLRESVRELRASISYLRTRVLSPPAERNRLRPAYHRAMHRLHPGRIDGWSVRRRVRAVAVLLALLAVVAALPTAHSYLRATAFTADVVLQLPVRPLAWATHAPTVEDFEWGGEGSGRGQLTLPGRRCRAARDHPRPRRRSRPGGRRARPEPHRRPRAHRLRRAAHRVR